MSQRRIVVIDLDDPVDAADRIADRLRGRAAAAVYLRDALEAVFPTRAGDDG